MPRLLAQVGVYTAPVWLKPSASAGLLVLTVAAVCTAACGSGDETVEERWARLDVPEPEIVFLGDWTDEERAAISWEVKSVQVHHHERFGVVTSEFTLYISTERELLTEPYRERYGSDVRQSDLPAWFTCDGFIWAQAIFIVLETCDEDEKEYGGPIAHEYFHILQHHLGLVSPPHGDAWPNWLAEGSAIYASALYAEEQGRRTLTWRREVARLAWSGVGVGFFGEGWDSALGTLLNRTFPPGIGFLAAEWLVERRGEDALMEFFRLGGGRHEFEEAFGMSPDEFRVAFEKHRQEVAPPFTRRIAGQVVDAEGKAIREVWVSALVLVEDKTAEAVGERTGPYGEFEFNGPGSGYRLGVYLRCPTHWASLGEWGEEGFVVDSDGRWDEEDHGAKPFSREAHRTGIVIELPETEKALVEQHCNP